MNDISILNSAFHEEIGMKENPMGSNNIKYNTDYYGHEVSGDKYPWCCVFIWWVFRKCGMLMKFCAGNKTAYCPFVVNWAKNNNSWVESDYQIGDILLYDWDKDGKADHIGWCAGVSKDSIKSIEGNSSDSVRLNIKRSYEIMGAYRPKYEQKINQDENSSLNPETSNLEKNKKADTYTVKSGDNLWAIGQKLKIPYLDIAKENNISAPYVIHPGQVLKIPSMAPSGNAIEIIPSEMESSKEYVVKKGDTLWGIGQKYKVSYKLIAIENGIDSPYIIRPGQVLKIP